MPSETPRIYNARLVLGSVLNSVYLTCMHRGICAVIFARFAFRAMKSTSRLENA